MSRGRTGMWVEGPIAVYHWMSFSAGPWVEGTEVALGGIADSYGNKKDSCRGTYQ
jgi:hypothetical protein